MEIHHTKTYRLEQAVLGGKIMAINAYLKKISINNLTLHFKEQKKKNLCSKLEEGNNKDQRRNK